MQMVLWLMAIVPLLSAQATYGQAKGKIIFATANNSSGEMDWDNLIIGVVTEAYVDVESGSELEVGTKLLVAYGEDKEKSYYVELKANGVAVTTKDANVFFIYTVVEGDNKLEALYRLIDGKPGGSVIYSTEKQAGWADTGHKA